MIRFLTLSCFFASTVWAVPALAQNTALPQVTQETGNAAPDAAVPLGDPYEAYGTLNQELADQESAPSIEPEKAKLRIRTEGFDLAAQKNMSFSGKELLDNESHKTIPEDIRREAFDAAIMGLFPLSPDEIRGLLKQYDETEKASQEPAYDLPTPEVSVQTLSLDPGVSPPVIKTSAGNVTTLNILDMTGAPWPIQDITWAGDFEVIEPEEGGHMVRITPLAKFAHGNMSVRLLTLKTPVTFSLRADRDTVHYRVDARIPEYGPFAEAQLIEGGTALVAGNTVLTTVLDGVPPSGSQKLDVAGVDGRTTAYKIGSTTYVRTPLTLLSPGWESSVRSADGMNVYALADTPVLLLSDKGRFMRAHLKEAENFFDE